jgi:phosphate transport system substrate-binding protein
VLGDVYRNPDPRTYPVSSYSYMIVPTTTASPFNEAKGDTLGRFILYFLCTGQQKAKQLGYSPLPPNLVGFGFEAVTKIPGAPAPPPVDQCANPTITGEFSLSNVPLPSASQKQGASRSNSSGAAGNRRSGGSGAVTAGDLAADATTDTTLGEGFLEDGTAIDSASAAALRDVPTSVSRGEDDVPVGVYVAIVVMVLLIAFGPPTLDMVLRRRR